MKFIKQREEKDCGVFCLINIINFYGGTYNVEKLRDLSGTNQTGTTMLGLSLAAKKYGFTPHGFEGGTEHLKSLNEPCILHVVIDNSMLHYVVCYKFEKGCFLIGDPSVGLIRYTEEQLNQVWKSKVLLQLVPNDNFVKDKATTKSKWNFFFNYMKEDIQLLIVVTVLGVMFSLLGITLSVFSQQLIDKILPEQSEKKLINGLLLVAVLLIIRSVVGYIRGIFLTIQNRNFNGKLIDDFYSTLLYLPKTFFSSRKTGELVSLMEDSSRIQAVLAFVFGDLIKDFLLVLITIGFIFNYSALIGFVSLMILPAFFLVAFTFHEQIVTHQYMVMSSNAKKSSNYINTLQGIDTIKVHNKEQVFSLRNRMIYEIFQKHVLRLGKTGVTVQFVIDILSTFMILLIVTLSAYRVLSGMMTIGELTAVISITSILLPSASNLAFANIKLQGAFVAFDRMHDFLSIESESDEQKTKAATNPSLMFNSLSLQNVAFRYPGGKQLLKNISITLETRKLIGLVGESGSGKTSLLNILTRFYIPDDGDMRINGQLFSETSINDWRNVVGVVPQEISLYNGILLENICLSSTNDDLQKAANFCNAYGFDEYFNSFPQGYLTLLGEEGVSLSGGQKQMVGLARALYKQPQVLLLDEPTASMDKRAEQFVLNLIYKLKSEISIFLITHKVTHLMYADNIYLLEDGLISGEGSHSELVQGDNFYSSFFQEYAT